MFVDTERIAGRPSEKSSRDARNGGDDCICSMGGLASSAIGRIWGCNIGFIIVDLDTGVLTFGFFRFCRNEYAVTPITQRTTHPRTIPRIVDPDIVLSCSSCAEICAAACAAAITGRKSVAVLVAVAVAVTDGDVLPETDAVEDK